MSAHGKHIEGVELATWCVAGSASPQPSARRSRRRTTLADMKRDLQSLESKHPKWDDRALAALALFTLLRAAANVYVLSNPSSRWNDFHDSLFVIGTVTVSHALRWHLQTFRD